MKLIKKYNKYLLTILPILNSFSFKNELTINVHFKKLFNFFLFWLEEFIDFLFFLKDNSFILQIKLASILQRTLIFYFAVRILFFSFFAFIYFLGFIIDIAEIIFSIPVAECAGTSLNSQGQQQEIPPLFVERSPYLFLNSRVELLTSPSLDYNKIEVMEEFKKKILLVHKDIHKFDNKRILLNQNLFRGYIFQINFDKPDLLREIANCNKNLIGFHSRFLFEALDFGNKNQFDKDIYSILLRDFKNDILSIDIQENSDFFRRSYVNPSTFLSRFNQVNPKIVYQYITTSKQLQITLNNLDSNLERIIYNLSNINSFNKDIAKDIFINQAIPPIKSTMELNTTVYGGYKHHYLNELKKQDFLWTTQKLLYKNPQKFGLELESYPIDTQNYFSSLPDSYFED